MSRKLKRLNKFKKIGLKKNIYLGIKEKKFSKLIASSSKSMSDFVPSQILEYVFGELLNEFIHGTGPIPKELYCDLKKHQKMN